MTQPAIRHALLALFAGYGRRHPEGDTSLMARRFRAVWEAIDSSAPVVERIASIDLAMADFDASYFTEFCIDLLMLNVVDTETEDKGEDYFDTPEWIQVEDETADRGSEALNLMLYISEQKDEELPVSLDDYLHEFLLVDEEEFQEELELYEEVIENEGLVELPYEEIYTRGSKIADESPLDELIVPMFWFFKRPKDARVALDTIEQKVFGDREDVYTGVAAAMLAYYNGLDALPEGYVSYAQELYG